MLVQNINDKADKGEEEKAEQCRNTNAMQTTSVKESGTPRVCTRDSRESLDDGRKKCTENSKEAGREREERETR